MKQKFFLITSILMYSTFVFGQVLKDTVVDIDGNVYHTVKIGEQVWMQENLKVTKYRNGNPILTTQIQNVDKEDAPKYQWAYDNNKANVSTYGRLYTFYVVMDKRKLCPKGWHVATFSEWTELTIGSQMLIGGELKESGTTHWKSPNSKATNKTGFTALPGGFRSKDNFDQIGVSGIWWSSDDDNVGAWFWVMSSSDSMVAYNKANEKCAASVRCLKD